MKRIFRIPEAVVLLSLAAGKVSAAEPLAWSTNLPQAQAQAAAEHKSVLLFFHGSDWCPPCVEMERQVFKSPDFVRYARQALVLVDVDFPQGNTQSEALRRANRALQTRFNVGENFPSLVLLNGSGETVFQEAGYDGTGPAGVLAELRRHAPLPAAADSGGIRNATVQEFARLALDKDNVILDVRTPGEFEAGHLAGAVNLDVTAPDFLKRAGTLDKHKTYLVHCASGWRSAKACKELSQIGFASLYNLPGGYGAWIKAGEPVEK